EAEVAHILTDSEAKVVITSSDLLGKVEKHMGVLPSLHHVLLVDGGGQGACAPSRRRPPARATASSPCRGPTATSRSSSTPRGRRARRRGWPSLTPTSSRMPAPQPPSPSWIASDGGWACCPSPTPMA